MFNKAKGNSPNGTEIEPNSINIIGAGTQIIGEITSNGDIRIDGTLKGNITTKGKLVIGNSGVIIGDIFCKNSDISGKVEGKLSVAELLALKSTSNIQGNITTNKLAVEPGAMFTGTCNMNGINATEPKSDAKREARKE